MLEFVPVTDEELEALALGGDPDEPVPADAVPFRVDPGGDLLPQWYMPAPASGDRSVGPWRRGLVLVVVAAFLVIEAYGLCSTYGPILPG